MGRTIKSQSKHDACVRAEANSYIARGYEVWADIAGYPKPMSIGGYIPDIIASISGHTTVVEVETPDSVGTARDIKQRAAFKKWTNYSDKRHYRLLIAD